jgi:hypothetical protein
MPNMSPDDEWESVTQAGRNSGPAQRREMDSLSASVAEILESVGKANHGIEAAKKNLSGIWGLVVLGVVAIWYVAGFVAQYNQTLSNGSPALLKAVGDLKSDIASVKKVDDDRYDKLSDILRQQVNSNNLVQQQLTQVDRRLTRLEDKP